MQTSQESCRIRLIGQLSKMDFYFKNWKYINIPLGLNFPAPEI